MDKIKSETPINCYGYSHTNNIILMRYHPSVSDSSYPTPTDTNGKMTCFCVLRYRTIACVCVCVCVCVWNRNSVSFRSCSHYEETNRERGDKNKQN